MTLNLTIIVPTLNRTIFLKKLLNYYNKFKFSGEILILDSSDGEIKKKNKILCGSYKKLRIKYINIEGHPHEVMKKCINFAKSSYVVFSGDDDYFIVSALEKIISYLERRKNIALACGEAIVLYKLNNKMITTYEYPSLHARLEKTAFERTLANMRNYSVAHYSICRKNIFRESLKNVNRAICPIRDINDEHILAMSLICLGKAEKIKTPYLIRQIGHVRTNFSSDASPQNNKFKVSVDYLIYVLLKAIKKTDGIVNKFYKKKLHLEYKKNFFIRSNQGLLIVFFLKVLNFYKSSFFFRLRKMFVLNFICKFLDLFIFDKFYYNNIVKKKLHYKDLLLAINVLKKN
jgi:glycosyltransferase domain-containing protein